MDKIIGISLFYAIIYSLPLLSSQANVLYPFGALHGDTDLPKEDDGGLQISIDVDFPFFDQNHRSLFINTNGIISFLENVLEYTPESFPLGDNRRVVAPFWADVDTSTATGGDIWYRQITNATQLQDLTEEIMRVFAVDFAFRPFVASWALVVTWHDVTFYNKHGSVIGDQPKNTFQAVLLTDQVHSFTIFNYDNIEWTTGASSGGDKTTGLGVGDDAIAAQVGFNAGDNKNYYSVPNSRTNDIVNIVRTTNVGRPGSEGRWVFRIDNKEIEAGGCEGASSSTLRISPEMVSMLGGEVLSISGPCFDPNSNVYCRMDGHLIQASYDFARDPFTVRCPTPIFMKLGAMPVELSKDGGVTFVNNTGYISIVGLERQTPRVTRDVVNDILEVNINPSNFPDHTSIPGSTRIDIYIYSYKEDKTTGEVVLKPEFAFKKESRLSQTKFLDINKQLADVDVALLRVVVAGSVDEDRQDRWVNGVQESIANIQPIAAIWSMPYNANPEELSDAQQWCQEWETQERVLDVRSDDVIPCPCTLQQAVADIGRFEPDPWCSMTKEDMEGNCRYRPLAKHCIRARTASGEGRGQLCCYANDDNLLILQDVPDGGFVQRNHHGGFLPTASPGTVPYLSNLYNDRVPWEQCCPRSYDMESCDLFRQKRPSSDCKEYQSPKAATVFGDPHYVTFDGSDYTFNGFGEFTILRVADPQVTLQARMAETMRDVLATGVIALVMSSESDVVQVELNERRVMDTWVKRQGTGSQTWSRLAFDQSVWWDAEGVTIEQIVSNSIVSVLIVFDSGLSVTVSVPMNANAMSVIIVAPPSVKDKTSGLLGTWNDDASDDIQTPSSKIITNREDPYTLHNMYGLEWAVQQADSLFRYDIGVNHTTVNRLDYVPTFTLGSSVSEEKLEAVCEKSKFCRYDYHKTNNDTTAKSTKDAEDDFLETDKGTTPVSTCGYVTPPDAGKKDGIVYINGSSVTFTCNIGYRLTGAQDRICVSGAWSGNATVCEKIEEDTTLLIIIIASAIGGVLVLVICFFCMICLCRRRNKEGKNKKRDQEMGSVNGLMHPANSSATASRNHSVSYDKPLPFTPEEENMFATRHNEVNMPLPLTPDEEHAIANGYTTEGQIREARISNGHAHGSGNEGARHSLQLPAGAVAIFPPSNADSNVNGHVRDARLVGNGHAVGGGALVDEQAGAPSGAIPAPPKKSPKKRAKENDYDDPAAVRRGKTRAPSNRMSGLPTYREESSDGGDDSEDEIARIKAQMRADMQQS